MANLGRTRQHPSSALGLARVTLRSLIALNWALGALIFALLVASLLAEAWTWRALGVDGAAGHPRVVAGMRAIMAIGLVGTAVHYIVLSRLLRIVESVSVGEAFTTGNADRLRAIAYGLLGSELLHLGVVAIASAVSKEVPLRISGNFAVSGWLAVLLLFVLAQVFREGTLMREDLEGTV